MELDTSPTTPARNHPALPRTTARTTGLFYLAMVALGVPAFLVIRPMLFDPDSPSGTSNNLLANETVARLGIGAEMGLVIATALTSLWFYKLFARRDTFAAGALAAFGVVNAITILISAAALATALELALTGADAGTAQLMYMLSGNLWGVGALFFGLWLMPMGLLALRAGLPRILGWLLVVGGVGYVASAFVAYLLPGSGALAEALTVPASVAEFWMIAWLLFHGWRRVRA